MTSVDSRDEDLEWFRRFVTESRWRFAKTYVESYPHEYTLKRWVEGGEFDRAILSIERWGVTESFFSARHKYLYVDDRKYWHMGDASSGDPEKQPGLINRTWVDVGRYREEAERLGYDRGSVELLVERWRVMLERARKGT